MLNKRFSRVATMVTIAVLIWSAAFATPAFADGKGKRVPVCFEGHTEMVRRKHVDEWIAKGATEGACEGDEEQSNNEVEEKVSEVTTEVQSEKTIVSTETSDGAPIAQQVATVGEAEPIEAEDCGQEVCIPLEVNTEVVQIETGDDAREAVDELIEKSLTDGLSFDIVIQASDQWTWVQEGDVVTLDNTERNARIIAVVTECVGGVYFRVDPQLIISNNGEVIADETITDEKGYIEVTTANGDNISYEVRMPRRDPVIISWTGVCEECTIVPPPPPTVCEELTDWSSWQVVTDWSWDSQKNDYFRLMERFQYDARDGSSICNTDHGQEWQGFIPPVAEEEEHESIKETPAEAWCPNQPYLRAMPDGILEWRDGSNSDLPLILNLWQFEIGEFSNPTIHWSNCKYAAEYTDESGRNFVRVFDFGGTLLNSYEGYLMPEFPLDGSDDLYAIRESDGQLVRVNIATNKVELMDVFDIRNPISITAVNGVYIGGQDSNNLLKVVAPSGQENPTEQVCQRPAADQVNREFVCRTETRTVAYNPATGETREVIDLWRAAAINPEDPQQIALTGVNLLVKDGVATYAVADEWSFGGSDWGGKSPEPILGLRFAQKQVVAQASSDPKTEEPEAAISEPEPVVEPSTSPEPSWIEKLIAGLVAEAKNFQGSLGELNWAQFMQVLPGLIIFLLMIIIIWLLAKHVEQERVIDRQIAELSAKDRAIASGAEWQEFWFVESQTWRQHASRMAELNTELALTQASLYKAMTAYIRMTNGNGASHSEVIQETLADD